MKPVRPRLLALMAISVLAPVSCRKEAPVDESDVLAKVAGRPIRTADFERELERLRTQRRPIAGKKALLDEIVEYEALLEYARKNRIDQDPEVRRAYRNLLIGKLKERDLAPKLEAITVTKEEIQAAYEVRRESLIKPELRRLSIIRIAKAARTSETRMEELKATITVARELAATAEGFTAAAAKFSEDQATRYRGGDIGWSEPGKPHGRIPIEVLNAGHALQSDGELSSIIEAGDGFYLVSRTAAKLAELPPIQQVKDRLRAELLRDKREKVGAAFEQTIRSAISVELFPDRLGKVRWQAAVPSTEDVPPDNP